MQSPPIVGVAGRRGPCTNVQVVGHKGQGPEGCKCVQSVWFRVTIQSGAGKEGVVVLRTLQFTTDE